MKCMRVQEGSFKTVTDNNGTGYFHKLGDDVKVHMPKPKPVKPIADVSALHATWEGKNVPRLAELLGVSVKSLERLRVGFDGVCWITPMFTGAGVLVGGRKRYENGKQTSVPGGHSGIFIPTDITTDDLYIVEGSSDLCAILDLGFDGIGRPSCSGGTEYIKQYLSIFKRRVVIVSDNDEPKKRPDGTTFRPGQIGAEKLCDEILPLTRSATIIKPPRHPDIRAWYLDGCTRDKVLRLIKNTTTIYPERGKR